MTQDTFSVKIDNEQHEYVAMNKTEVTKNHQGGHKQSEIDYSDNHCGYQNCCHRISGLQSEDAFCILHSEDIRIVI